MLGDGILLPRIFCERVSVGTSEIIIQRRNAANAHYSSVSDNGMNTEIRTTYTLANSPITNYIHRPLAIILDKNGSDNGTHHPLMSLHSHKKPRLASFQTHIQISTKYIIYQT